MRFRVTFIFWLFALLAAAMGTFGPSVGLLFGGGVAGFWALIRTQHFRLYARGFLLLLVLAVVVYCLCLPAAQHARESAHRGMCMSNLKQIILALHSYESVHGRFPPAYTTDENGNPMHSWRVLILPYLEEEKLYNAYDLDEPWNGPNNRNLADRMPDVYACPGCRACAQERNNPWELPGKNCTNYFAVVGGRTVMRAEESLRFRDIIPEGTSDTLVLIESSARSVNWMKPADFSVEEAIQALTNPQPLAHVERIESLISARYLRGSGLVAWADGSTNYLGPLIEPTARAFCTLDGNEALEEDARRQVSGCIVNELVIMNWGRVFSLLLFVLLSVAPYFWKRPFAEAPA